MCVFLFTAHAQFYIQSKFPHKVMFFWKLLHVRNCDMWKLEFTIHNTEFMFYYNEEMHIIPQKYEPRFYKKQALYFLSLSIYLFWTYNKHISFYNYYDNYTIINAIKNLAKNHYIFVSYWLQKICHMQSVTITIFPL